MTGSAGPRQAPACGGGQRAAQGERWRINSCFCGQVSLKREKGGSGYISLVILPQNYTFNPDGVNKKVERGIGVKCCPHKHSGLLLCKRCTIGTISHLTALRGRVQENESILIVVEVIRILRNCYTHSFVDIFKCKRNEIKIYMYVYLGGVRKLKSGSLAEE